MPVPERPPPAAPTDTARRRHRLLWAPLRFVGPMPPIALVLSLCFYGAVALDDAIGLHFLARVELASLDARFRLRGPRPAPAGVAIAAIDNRSLERLGRWPWSRSRLAELVRRLQAAGASAVAFDILFLEPQNVEELERLRGLEASFDAVAGGGAAPSAEAAQAHRDRLAAARKAADADADFAAAIADWGNVVLGYNFPRFAGDGGPPVPEAAPTPAQKLVLDTSSYTAAVAQALADAAAAGVWDPRVGTAVQAPLEKLAEGGLGGFVSYLPDRDGGLRRQSQFIAFGSNVHMPLALQGAMVLLDVKEHEIRLDGRALVFGARRLPLDRSGALLLNYYGAGGAVPTYGIADILDGTVGADRLRGRLVFVGATGEGLGDVFLTPFSARLPGVESHATVAANVAEGRFLEAADVRDDGRYLWGILAAALAFGIAVPRASPTIAAGACAAGLLLYQVAAYRLFVDRGLWINVTVPTLAVGGTFVVLLVLRLVGEERSKRQVKRMFGQFVDKDVLIQLLERREGVAMGGEKREITAFFSDIAGFTSLSEKMDPVTTVALVNRYLSQMTRAILAERGYLNKYMGDGIMALYGAPLPAERHAEEACRAALANLAELARLNAALAAEGRPTLRVRIGLATGEMLVGLVGSEQKVEYTAMGDFVNLASRLEGACKQYGVVILANERCYDLVKGRIACREVDLVRVKGKGVATRVYEVLGEAGGPLRLTGAALALYNEGLALYKDRQWAAARKAFEGALAAAPGDGPSRLYADRCALYEDIPPGLTWDGVTVLDTK